MLTLIGLAIIVVIVALLLTEKVSPVISMVLVPLVGALVAGFSPEEINAFYRHGISSVVQVVTMFIFAILFFGVMNDVGLFDPLIRAMVRITRGNVIAVAVGTVLISAVAQLDGAGASTFLLVVPPLLPLYRRLKMSPYLLFLLLAASAGVVNMLPWGGPVGRVATVLEMDAVVLWRALIPVQAIGLVMLLAMAVFLGLREQRRIRAMEQGDDSADAGAQTALAASHGAALAPTPVDGLAAALQPHGATELAIQEAAERAADEARAQLLRPRLRWVNALVFLLTLAVLVMGLFPPGYTFMIALCVALVINYPQPKMQIERINAHAGGAIMMASIILAAGTFLGILKESGMLNSIAVALVDVLPAVLLPYLHLVIGAIGIPLELVLSTDAYYFALFPVVEQITSQAGVAPTSAGYAMIIGSIVGTFVSPFSPALWMGLGLAKLSTGQHIRYSFFWIWGLSLSLLAATCFLGII
ncbi:citrate transporter [Comamonas piscis]|uniref:Citrate transporter n=1 Tax=Comamonas piscis TaxID=1562974 RepID=A0A7G5ED01_9BURK|nr:SLC13 family permease [Comamonas piscis]QMV71876.1 citrate transporter [Comamonas piscis]WSO34612.1 SLC13 family permease [Comamonas piscis]